MLKSSQYSVGTDFWKLFWKVQPYTQSLKVFHFGDNPGPRVFSTAGDIPLETMLSPVNVAPIKSFYPYAKTSATCLTQYVPRQADANILLLSCGDPLK